LFEDENGLLGKYTTQNILLRRLKQSILVLKDISDPFANNVTLLESNGAKFIRVHPLASVVNVGHNTSL
jgi:hypothetical protein